MDTTLWFQPSQVNIQSSKKNNKYQALYTYGVESSWNVMAHGDAREGKWRENWRMEWISNTLHTTSEHGVSSITSADAHTSAASSRLNWLPRRFKWTLPFRWKTKSDFCACVITFQTQSASWWWAIDAPDTCWGVWRNILKTNCGSSWFSFYE
jgi:hypothetical protein